MPSTTRSQRRGLLCLAILCLLTIGVASYCRNADGRRVAQTTSVSEAIESFHSLEIIDASDSSRLNPSVRKTPRTSATKSASGSSAKKRHGSKNKKPSSRAASNKGGQASAPPRDYLNDL